MTIKGIKISAVRAYNIDNDYPHSKDKDWLGFIVNTCGVRIYLSGDTDLTPEMDNIICDIALLPVSGTYVMNAKDAIKAVGKIKPKIAIPMHYDSKKTHHWKIFPGVGTKEDTIKFRDGLDGICQPLLLSCSHEAY
jgi:L-ascorbate metabolism protein UlaG (beta-lactamase superfamily)